MILESLISVAIVGIFMSAVTYMMWGAIKANTLARKITECTAYASDIVEQISTMPMATVRAGGLTAPDITETDMITGNRFTRYRVQINTANDASYPNTVNVEVFVYWLDPGSLWVLPGTANTRVKGVTIRDIKT